MSPAPPIPPPPRILGLDPGLQVTGYAVLEPGDAGPRVCEAGVIRSAEAREPADMARRVRLLYDGIVEVLEQWRPGIMVVEQLYAHYKHPRTAILMGHARGIILLVAQRRGARIEQFAANRIKQSVVGHGHAGKSQMQRAIQSLWNLKEPPEPPDVADALAIALCCGRFIGQKRALPA